MSNVLFPTTAQNQTNSGPNYQASTDNLPIASSMAELRLTVALMTLFRTVAILLVLGGFYSAEGQLQIVSTLYQNSRPSSGETGTLRDIAASRECLFASWADDDGDHWLDTWSITSTPQFVEGHSFGNMFSDQSAQLPVAHLKSPRDMAVVGGRLFFWSLDEIWEASLRDNCSISEFRSASLSDARNNIMNRFTLSGGYGSTRRTFLSDQEFNSLLSQNVPLSELQDEQTDAAFLNVQIPGAPFIIAGKRNRGAQTLAVGDGSYLHLGDHPSMFELSQDLLTLNLTEYKPARVQHFNSMWAEALGGIFRLSIGERKLKDLLDELFSSQFISAHGTAVMRAVVEQFRVSLNKKLSDLLIQKFKRTADINVVMRSYRLSGSMSVKEAVDKIIARHLAGLDLDAVATDEIASRFQAQFFGDLDLPVSQIASQISGVMNGKLSSAGLEAYLVDTVLKPLIDSPNVLSLKLAPFLDAVSSNPVTGAIDAGLNTFHTAIPINDIPGALDFKAPACLTIPHSTRNLVDLAFVQSGPRLDPQGIALFELLKLGSFYLGSGDYADLRASLRTKIEGVHAALGTNAASEFVRALNISGDVNVRPFERFKKFFGQIGVRAQLSEALSEAVLKRLEAKGIKRSVKLSVVLKQISKSNRRSKITVGDFQSWMNKRGLGITLSVLSSEVGLRYSLPLPGISIASNSNANLSVIRRGAEQLLLHIFGPIDLNLSLKDAAVTFINTRISPKIVGDFVSFTIGEMLGKMSNNVTLPSVFGQAQLALRGDCIAGWRLAYTTAAATAASLGMINTSLALLNSEAGLGIAIDGSLKYVLDGLIGGFFSEVFGQSAGQYQGWHLRLQPTNRVIDLVAAAGRTGSLVDILSHRNKVIAVLRNMGASFPDAGGSKLVTLAVISADGSVERINLDGWSTVSAVHQAGDHFVLSGQREGGPIRSILALDLSQSPPKQHLLEGNELPPALSAPTKVLESRDRGALIIGSQFGGASILSVPR